MARQDTARPAAQRRRNQGDYLMLKDAWYGGINAAVVTAMNADLSIDLDRLAAHSHWLLANGCNGLAVLGTTGGANSLGINERINVLEGLAARGIPAAKM